MSTYSVYNIKIDNNLSLPDGSSATPSISFTSAPNTGIHRNASGDLAFIRAGITIAYARTNQFVVRVGSVASPSLTFDTRSTDGLFSPLSGQVGVSILGATAALFNSSGVRLPQLSNTLLAVNSTGQIIATASTGGGSQTLAQTLALGNNVGTYSIIGTNNLRLNAGASGSSFGSVLTLTESYANLYSGGVPGGPWYGSGISVGTSSISITAINDDNVQSGIQLFEGGIYLNGIIGTGSSFLTIGSNGSIGSTSSVPGASSAFTSNITTTTGSNTTIATISFGTYSVYSISADIVGYDFTNKLSYGAKAFGVFENNGTTYSLINTTDITEKTTFNIATSDIILGTSSMSIVVSGEPGKIINWKTDYTYTRN